MAATDCRSEELAALAKAIEKSRDLAKSEHSLELEQLVSRVASAVHQIGAMLAPEAVERVCWHRVAKLHLPVGGSHENLLTAVGKMVEVLSAPEHDSFSPSRDDVSSRGNFPHFPNPLEVTLKIDGTNARSRLQRALVETLLVEGITPREVGMWCAYCEICVNKSPNASIRTPRLTCSTSSAVYSASGTDASAAADGKTQVTSRNVPAES